jgi:CheY-like chemotaxis protein
MHKILIVDDDPIIRNLLVQILESFESHGVELLTAENGESAIDIIQEAHPNVVFLDVMMPKMNGFEVCSILKGNPANKDICVIMLTAKGQESDKHKANSVGADGYITKPFNIREITEKICEVLGIPCP